jgi:hypothetical protein
MSWNPIYLGSEGTPVLIGGVNVWTKQWKTQGEAVVSVYHPAYPNQDCRLDRYFIEEGNTSHEFAAGEVSPGVWLFCTPPKGSENKLLLHLAAYASAAAGGLILVHGFEQSPKYLALGSALVALGLAAEWYAKSTRCASKA